MVLGKLSVSGRPANLDYNRARDMTEILLKRT